MSLFTSPPAIPSSALLRRRKIRRLRTIFCNALQFLIPFLAAVWLLTVKPAHADYPNWQWWECPGGGYCAPPGTTGGTNSGYPGSNSGYPGTTGGNGDNTSTGTGNTGGSNSGYPGSTGGNNSSGSSGTTGGNNSSTGGYPGNTGGSTGGGGNSGYPGNTGGSNTGYPGDTGGNNSGGYPGTTGGNNSGGYPGNTGGDNSGYPGTTGGSSTGYPGDTGGNNSGGYPGTTGGNNSGYPGNTGGNNSGYPGNTGGSNTGYPGDTGGNNSGGYPGNTGGSNTGYPGDTGGNNTGGGPPVVTIVPGHWNTSYSSSGNTSWHYRTSSNVAQSDSHPWPTTGAGDGVQDDNYLDAKMSGTVTATLKWVPTTGMDATSDPPSSTVIVTEYAGASARGGSGVGKADDGWGDTSNQGGYPGSGSSSGYASSSGTHYEVKDGSSGTITVTSGTMSASTPDNTTPDANGNFSGMGVLVSTGFSVFPNPLAVSLSGTTDSGGSKMALTGQGVTAQLNGAPGNVSSYTWSFDGGTPIKNWNTSSSQTVPLAPTDLSQTDTSGNGIPVAPISFYYTKEGSLTVTCTVNFTLPDGKPGNKTVKSSKIIYKKPTADWTVDTSFYGLTSGFFSGYTDHAFGALELWGPIKITEPASFAKGGVGTGCIVQIATLDRSCTRYNNPLVPTYSKLSVTNNDGTTSSVKAPTGLDVGFPYPYGYDWKPDGTLTPNNVNYTWKASGKGYAADKPNQPYQARDVDNGGSQWYASTAKDSFDTYVMYQPPSKDGQGAIYVPLQKLTWSWGGGADLLLPPAKADTWAASEGPSFKPGKPKNLDEYPSWTLTIPRGFSLGP